MALIFIGSINSCSVRSLPCLLTER